MATFAILRTHSWAAPTGFYRVAATRRDLRAAQEYAARMMRRGRHVKVVALRVPLGAGEYLSRAVADSLASFPVNAGRDQ